MSQSLCSSLSTNKEVKFEMPKEGYKSVTVKTEKYLKLKEIAKAKGKTVSETLVFLIDEFSEYPKTHSV